MCGVALTQVGGSVHEEGSSADELLEIGREFCELVGLRVLTWPRIGLVERRLADLGKRRPLNISTVAPDGSHADRAVHWVVRDRHEHSLSIVVEDTHPRSVFQSPRQVLGLLDDLDEAIVQLLLA